MNLTILMMTILTKKGFISSDPGSSVSHARLPPSFFNSEVLQKENFPIKKKENTFEISFKKCSLSDVCCIAFQPPAIHSASQFFVLI